MELIGLCEAIFLQRLNRFAALVELDGAQTMAHVPNSGRLKELLLPGVPAMVQPRSSPGKTSCRLVMVRRGDAWVMIDAQLSNALAAEAVQKGLVPGIPAGSPLCREVRWGNSRFDLRVDVAGRQHFIEVKCSTLVEDGVAYFPDAPTQRGVKHIREMMELTQGGGSGHILFLVQHPRARALRPHDSTDAAFGVALRAARQAGVDVRALLCRIEPDFAGAVAEVPVQL
ncbi:MAG: DNA/RNA nuclease SfsA [Eubacteriales bacterium]|nr:DNA/RNA nuclease SfsA [Eubacteriales bacterium]